MTVSELINPNATIDDSAQIGDNVIIHPYAVIGPNVVIGDNCEIFPHTYIEYSEIGNNTKIYSGAAVGTAPQDLGYKNESTKVIIGDGCQIRENATVNRSSKEGCTTEVGDNCMLMIGAHIAHDCKVGNEVVIANNVLLGGHVLVEDFVFIGGAVVAHQNIRIGEMTIIGGASGMRQDLPPYSKVDGRPGRIQGLNLVGLKRRGVTLEERTNLKKAFNHIWFSELNTKQAIEKIEEELPSNKYIEHLIDFINSSKRGITKLAGKPEVEDF